MSKSEELLEIRNVVKKYGPVTALDQIDLELNPGIYGLLGQNGAGKTTLIRLLAGIQKPDAGEICLNGQLIWKMAERYRNILGYMPQAADVDIDITASGFLRYMAALKKIQNPDEKIQSLMQELHLTEYRNERLNHLSGGTRQRVMIAQALLNDPKILLLDEPTAGLDPVERKNLRNMIAVFGKDRIVLVATHVISDVEFTADRIIMMKAGKILTVQDSRSLMENTRVCESPEDLSVLLALDPQLKVVNQQYRDGKMYTRFISRTADRSRVGTTMDDVYLDWLG